ncbi:RDD family protein [Nocardia transvalensis]|uniref:RDD family protein n=1 Tax=Nocardia transvalensis TaxID=37333 RepID=UPI001895E663|nr:RDD family protein [Nocardia transvalensis]MBF6330253.1 RDD family protein [Nocardia transvalensis]
MGRITGSWLSGPNAADPGDPAPGEYPGELLGLPESGAGSLASMMRRIVALFVDWFIAMGIAALIVRGGSVNTVTLLVWFVIGIVTVTLFGFTPGQFFLRLRVIRIDAAVPVGFVRALARQVLLIFVVPALFTDSDGRGMHDRATGTALVRSR